MPNVPLSIKTRLPLFVVLLVFIVCKIPHLHYAYYWDECTPYAVAIKDMYKHGISLMPDALDPEISKGHPLLFHALAATWMKLFGPSHVAMHSFALTISLLLLIAIYETGLRLFNQRVAVLALLITALQEAFFAQSTMVLPEVLVALLCFTSIVFYLKEKFALAALSLALLFYTKESGLVLGLVLGIDALTGVFQKEAGWKKRIGKLAAVGVPVVLAALFFVIQKQTRGWYLFPQHAGLVIRDWNIFWFNFRINAVRYLFYDCSRNYYFVLLMIVAAISAVKQKQLKYLAILLPAVCIYYFVDDMRAGRLLPGIPFFIVFILSVVLFLYSSTRKDIISSAPQRKFIWLAGIFVLCYLIFCGLNFFTPRYILAAMMPLFFITAVLLERMTRIIHTRLYYLVVVLIIAIGAYAFYSNDGFGDCDRGAFDGLYVQQGVVDFMEDKQAYEQHICTGSFLELIHLTNPSTGFLHSDRTFKYVKWEIDENSHYAIFDNMENDGRYSDLKKDTAFRLIKRIEKGKVWADIYERK